MRKSIITIIILSIFSICPTYSISSFYMAPSGATVNINLAADWDDKWTEVNYNGGPIFDTSRQVVMGGIE